MWNATRTLTLLLTLLPALAGCDAATPSTPSPAPPLAPPARRPWSCSASQDGVCDVRPARCTRPDHPGQHVERADLDSGRNTPARLQSSSFIDGGHRHQFIEGKICAAGCAFEVRFGTEDGDRRAYLTVDYGHDNPGTVVDVEVAGGELLVTQTDVYPPGSPTLSGVVTGMTARGHVPLEGVVVARGISTGWRSTRTDRNGFYEIRGLIDGNESVYIAKDGYEKQTIRSRHGGRHPVRHRARRASLRPRNDV